MDATAPPPARPAADRFFLAILGGLALLLVAAGVSVLVARRPAQQLPADSPGGTVQRFYAAVETGDYPRAYDLLGDGMPSKPTRDDFVRFNTDRGGYDSSQPRRIRIDSEQISGDHATVAASVTQYSAGNAPLIGSNEFTYTETFGLDREAAGWRITDLPFRYRPYPAKPPPN